MDTLIALDANDIKNNKEIVPGILLTTANATNIKFFSSIYNAMCNYHLIDDSPSIISNDPSFIEHRHDQSIFSIFVHKYFSINMYTSYDELFRGTSVFKPRGNNHPKKYF